MPIPPPSFTKSKWLAFFAELTAQVNHHSILVAIEGCERLKRLLLTRISIAALLQEGDLLQTLMDTLVGGLRSERLLGASVALNEELIQTQLETLSLCVDMAVSLHADGDAYYCLLVRARCGCIVQGLLDMLQRVHPHFFGITARLVESLLTLPLGRDDAAAQALLSTTDATSGAVTTAATSSIALRRHITDLCELCKKHGTLLQESADVLSAIVTTTAGPQRFAALKLLGTTLKRLRKYKLRHVSGVDYETSMEMDVYRAGLNRTNYEVTLHDDESEKAERTRTEEPINAMSSSAAAGDDGGAAQRMSSAMFDDSGDAKGEDEGMGEDVSAIVDKEPCEIACDVPVTMMEGALAAIDACASHNDFFDALDCMWCLTVADGRLLAECFTPARFASMRRFLTVAPITRQDRCLFTSLLLWVGNAMSSFTLRDDTRDAILEVTGTSLVGMLHFEFTAREATDSQRQQHSRRQPLYSSYATSPSMTKDGRFSSEGASSVYDPYGSDTLMSGVGLATSVNGATQGVVRSVAAAGELLPYSLAKQREEMAALQAPSIAVILISFLLNAERAASPSMIERWVRGTGVGVHHSVGVLTVVERGIRRVAHTKSTLIDTPTTIDGALSDEVYLACAMDSVRSDDITLGTLSCKLLAALLWGHAAALHKFLASEVAQLVRDMTPALAHIAINNPTLASSSFSQNTRGAVARSALYHCPAGARSSRYTSLGECALAALDTCLWFARSTTSTTMAAAASTQMQPLQQSRFLDNSLATQPLQEAIAVVKLTDMMPVIPQLSRCTSGSIHGTLRAIPFRALSALCRSPTDLLLVLSEMPSAVSAAVASVLSIIVSNGSSNGHTDRSAKATTASALAASSSQWEIAAAAEWLSAVADIAATLPTVAAEADNFDLGRTALPQELLPTLAQCPVCHASAAVLSLLLSISEQQSRLAPHRGSGSGSGTGITYCDALAPQGARSVHFWHSLIRTSTSVNAKLVHISNAPMRPAESANTKDALSRALSSVESIAVQYSFACSVARGVRDVMLAHPEYFRTGNGTGGLPHQVVYNFLVSALALPPPLRVFELLSSRFATRVTYHPTLVRVYAEMVEWVCELACVWFNQEQQEQGAREYHVDTARDFPPLPDALFTNLCRLLSDRTVSERTRCCVAPLVSTLVVVSGVAFHVAVARHSAALFEASLALEKVREVAPCVSGMQCRLLRTDVQDCSRDRPAAAAAVVAVAKGWLAERIGELDAISRVLVENKGALSATDREAFLATLSLTCSTLASDACPALDVRHLRQPLCAALCECLRFESTRVATLEALRAVALSEEGRQCLLHEISASGEPLGRTCFGRLLALTLDIPSVWVERSSSLSAPSPRKNGTVGSPTRVTLTIAEKEAMQRAVKWLGYEICTTVCGKGGRGFIAAVLRHRGLQVIAALIAEHDHSRSAIKSTGVAATVPTGLLAFLATLSFDTDVQRGIMQLPGLLTILIDVAGEATASGTLALLILRNLCFHAGLKTSMCQDARVLLTLKAALLGQPTAELSALDVTCPDGVEEILETNHVNGTSADLLEWATRTVMRSNAARSSDPGTSSTGNTERMITASPSSEAREHGGKTLRTPKPRKQRALKTVKEAEKETDGIVTRYPASGPEILRRQGLGVSALWSLMYDHARGRTYVRRALGQSSGIDVTQLSSGVLRQEWEQLQPQRTSPKITAGLLE